MWLAVSWTQCVCGQAANAAAWELDVLEFRLSCHTNRAAECWTFWRRPIRNFGSPNSKELQLSNLEVIRACTRISVSDFERQFLIFEMLRRWKKHTLQTLTTSCSRDMCWSKIILIFLAEVDGWMRSLETWRWLVSGREQCCALSTNSSVFSTLSFSILHSIHVSISLKQCWIHAKDTSWSE